MPYTLLDEEVTPSKKGGYVLLNEPTKSNDASDSSIVALGAGLGKGVGTVALNAQKYLGKGLNAFGADTYGDWLQSDANKGLKNLESEVTPYRENSPIATGAGELGGEIAATLPVGGLIGKGVGMLAKAPALARAAPVLESISDAAKTGGMRANGATGIGGLAARTVGGAATGYASGGLVDPEQANTSGVIGAALPGVLKTAGKVGDVAGSYAKKLISSGVSDDVANLAEKAKSLGIDIPADRLANSRPLNAVASALNYVPFSGRAATEDLMNSQLNRAVSKTFGQNSPNVTMALRKADDQLGAQFEHTLKNNGVKFDDKLLNDITDVYTTAEKELGSDSLKPITNQINELIEKGQSGTIDGQAAYNIKKILDRIGRGSGNEAYHAIELKSALMNALDRSLGPDQAKAFAKTRQQYGNMLSLEKLAPNGVEGELSAARLANMRNINNPQLQDIADIAAQFVKPREGQHGAAQRGAVGLGTAMLGGLPGVVAGVASGRAANAALNSERLKNMMLGKSVDAGTFSKIANNPDLKRLFYQSAPVVSSQ